MNSDRFGGKITINVGGPQGARGRDPFRVELDATLEQFRACGFKVPGDASATTMAAGIGGAFITAEMPPAQFLPDTGPATKQYFGREVRPQLAERAEKGDRDVLKLAHQVGRLIGAGHTKGLFGPDDPLTFDMGRGELKADGIRRRYDIQTGWVVDFGMGVTGLTNHLQNVKDGFYSVIAMQKTRGEQAALQGAAQNLNVPAEDMQIFAGGIKQNTDGLIEASGEHLIDVVLASRVHEAGDDLEAGIRRTGDMLRSGGLLVARGPVKYPSGIDYDKLLRIVRQDPSLQIVENKEYQRQGPRKGPMEPCRVFMAEAK